MVIDGVSPKHCPGHGTWLPTSRPFGRDVGFHRAPFAGFRPTGFLTTAGLNRNSGEMLRPLIRGKTKSSSEVSCPLWSERWPPSAYTEAADAGPAFLGRNPHYLWTA